MVGLVQLCIGQKGHLTMAVYKDADGRWRFRTQIRLDDGSKVRVSGTAPKDDNTKQAAIEAERKAVHEARNAAQPKPKKEVPTYTDWFNGRFWKEWVIGERNKPSERRSKDIIFRCHLQPELGHLKLDEINAEVVQKLRAKLVDEKELGDKRINNVMVVLSKSLRYALDCELIERMPKCRVKKIERNEIEAWTYDEYKRILDASKREGPEWYAAACLAGEAGLRIGEIRGLRWREDVDMVAKMITVNQQRGNGLLESGDERKLEQVSTTPKGRTRRTIPMTSTLYEALKALEVVREGYVVREMDGSPVSDAKTSHQTYRICRLAGLPEKGWHKLRHTFGTHAARFGVNPWQLMEWMGHKRIDETMGYVHIVERRPRPIPAELVSAGMKEIDPNMRVLKMLAARAKLLPNSEAASGTSEMMSAG